MSTPYYLIEKIFNDGDRQWFAGLLSEWTDNKSRALHFTRAQAAYSFMAGHPSESFLHAFVSWHVDADLSITKAWGTVEGDANDPNYGRACGVCLAPIRAGGRYAHECTVSALGVPVADITANLMPSMVASPRLMEKLGGDPCNVESALADIRDRPASVGLTHAKVLAAEIQRLDVNSGRHRMVADAATLALIPERFRVAPSCEEPSAYGVAVGASVAAMTAAIAEERRSHDEYTRMLCNAHEDALKELREARDTYLHAWQRDVAQGGEAIAKVERERDKARAERDQKEALRTDDFAVREAVRQRAIENAAFVLRDRAHDARSLGRHVEATTIDQCAEIVRATGAALKPGEQLVIHRDALHSMLASLRSTAADLACFPIDGGRTHLAREIEAIDIGALIDGSLSDAKR